MAISSDNVDIIVSSTLTSTQGFHTTSITRLALRGSRPPSCTLHLYFTIPAHLFTDPYELDHRRAHYTFQRFGGGNLEAPVFAPGGASGPSALLLDLTIPEGRRCQDDPVDNDDADGSGSVLSIEVPLHARYGVPKMADDLVDEVLLPPPEAFWTCAQGGVVGGGGGGEGALFLVFACL